ncbi:MAG: sterol desaturase family protein [Pseudobdellovibrio sp.]
MEVYAKILLFAMPAFLFFVLLEKFYGIKKGRDTVPLIDMISSLTSGATNIVKEVLGLTFVILSYSWLVERVALVHVENKWFTYLVAFIAIDFAGYWVHRWSHEMNIIWNVHVIHHSSEEFNLACALRQTISLLVNPFSVILLPAALLGVPYEVIATVGPLHLFAQFWYHTLHVGKMGLFEKVIVTPSHHRVHHAVNLEYMDKNYGQIFIFWDKIFGTYQEELKEVVPVFGISRPADTWNPIKINFQHFWLLLQDARRTKNTGDKFLIWFRKTGYRPSDVESQYPIKKISNVYQFEKYGPELPSFLKFWSAAQLGVLLLSIFGLFFYFAVIQNLTSWGLYSCGLFVFISVYAMTDLMDRNRSARYWELLRAILGFTLIFTSSVWLGKWSAVISVLFSCYLITSVIVSLTFTRKTRY